MDYIQKYFNWLSTNGVCFYTVWRPGGLAALRLCRESIALVMVFGYQPRKNDGCEQALISSAQLKQCFVKQSPCVSCRAAADTLSIAVNHEDDEKQGGFGRRSSDCFRLRCWPRSF